MGFAILVCRPILDRNLLADLAMVGPMHVARDPMGQAS